MTHVRTIPGRPRIAVDTEGGDLGPAAIVDGAVAAARRDDIDVVLVGRPGIAGLVPAEARRTVEVHETSEVVEMADDPEEAIRAKRASSVLGCATLLREGRVDGLVSPGNTGAVVLATVARVGRMPGVAVPAIAVSLPALDRLPVVMVDAGASVDVRPGWLRQFALLGRAYSSARYGIAEPRVGLLSNGVEATKGDAARREADGVLRDVPGYVGQVEGTHLGGGDVDVIVTDGLTGNVALKSYEAGMRAAVLALGPDYGGGTAQAIADLRARLAVERGGVILGLRRLVTVIHGASTADAVAGGVRFCAELAGCDVVRAVARELRSARG